MKNNFGRKNLFPRVLVVHVLLASALLCFFVLAPHSFAQSTAGTQSKFTALAPIPNLTDGTITNSLSSGSFSFATFFKNLYTYLIGISVILAIIMIIWGGLQYATQDSVSNKGAGKERIKQALFGLILVLSPVLVFSIINPSILNFNLNFSLIPQGTVVPPGAGSSTVDPTTQCQIYGNANVIEFAVCPSTDTANTWGQTNCPAPGILESVPTPANFQNNAGTITTVSCTQANLFDFVYLGTGFLIPNQVWPLAITSNSSLLQGSKTIYSTNGSDAIQYSNTCTQMGLETCVSEAPKLSWSHACLPTPSTTAPASAPKPLQCYIEQLSCKDASFANLYCATSPSWTILN